MKKAVLLAGSLAVMAVAVSAQTTKKAPPPPPKPPKPPVEMTTDVPPSPPPPPPPPAFTEEEIAEMPQDYQDFMKRNPSVGSVHWNHNSIFIVPKKGKPERFVLDEKGIQQAEAKYGKLPSSPPPPPRTPKAPVPPRPED